MRVLVVQSAQDAGTSVAALVARGHDVLSAPLVSAERTAAPVVNLAGAQAFIVTSAEGARALAELVGVRTFPVFTDGDVTAAELKRLGFKQVETAKDDAADLARLVERKLKPAGGALIYACSTSAPINLTAMLSNMGFAVRSVPLYTLKRAEKMPDSLRAALTSRALDAALFFSADEARAFVALVQRDELEPLVNTLAAVPAPPIVAAPLRALKLGVVSVPAAADPDTLFGALDVKLVDKVEEDRHARERQIKEEAERERAAKAAAEKERQRQEDLVRARAAEEAARERAARERAEAERLAKEQAEREAAERKHLEQERLERERAERAEAERKRAAEAQAEKQRLAEEKAKRDREEQERKAREKDERERQAAAEKAERERLAAERTERERQERERKAQEKAERERLVAEKAAAEKAERERIAAERTEQERQERERKAQEKAERERLAVEKAAAEKAERERIVTLRAEQERVEKERRAAERAEQERLAAERAAAEKAERERLAAERAEQERLARAERERLAAEKAAAEKAERERLAAERAEKERIEREQAAAARAEQERIAAEKAAVAAAEAARVAQELAVREQSERARLAAEAAEQARVKAEQEARDKGEQERRALAQAEQERIAREKAEAERKERERLGAEQAEQDRIAREKAETEWAERARLAAEQAERDRQEHERLAFEKAERDRLERERLAAEKAEQDRIAREKAEAERAERTRLAAEQAERDRQEQERLAAEKAEQDRIAREKAVAERAERTRLAAEQAEHDRLEREKRAQERAEQDRIAREKAEAERHERERLAAEESERKRQERERVAQEKAERDRLAREGREREKAEQQVRNAAAKAEKERLAQEAAAQKRAAREEQARLKAEQRATQPHVSWWARLMGGATSPAAADLRAPWDMATGLDPKPKQETAGTLSPSDSPIVVVRGVSSARIEEVVPEAPARNVTPHTKEENRVQKSEEETLPEEATATPAHEAKPVPRSGGRAARLLAEDAADLRAKDQRFKYFERSEAPETESAEQTPSAQPHPEQLHEHLQQQPRRIGGVVLIAGIAAAAAFVLFTASGWVPRVKDFVQSPFSTEPSNGDIAAAQTHPAEPTPSAASVEAVNALRQDLAQRLAALEGRAPDSTGAVVSMGDSLSNQAKQLAAMSARLATLEAAIGNSARLEDIAKRMTALEGRTAEARTVLELGERVTSLETMARKTMVEQSSTIALVMAVGQWREAMLAGRPFAAELQTVKALAARLGNSSGSDMSPDDTGFAAHAERGIATFADLQRQFRATAAAATRAAVMPDNTSAWYRRILDRMFSIVTIRRLDGDAAGNSTSSVLARAERHLNESDLAGAVREMSGLTGYAGEAAAPWLDAARARVAAEHAAIDTTNKAVAALATVGKGLDVATPATKAP